MTLQTRGCDIVDARRRGVRLKGVNIGGWLNMENFITGYAANESMMRAAVRKVLGDDRYELFFERLLTGLLRRRRRRVPRRDRAELRAHPGQLPPPGVRRAAVRDHRGRLPPPRPGDRRGRRARRLHDHRPARAARLRRTSTGTRTTRRTGRCSGSTGTSRTASSASGRRSPTATRATRGSPATT